MNSSALAQPEARRVLATALVNAGKELGLTQQTLGEIIGRDRDAMRHWFQTGNLHTGGVPSEQVRNVQGLMRVVEYLDAIRGKL